ncbi:MAG: chromate transporter [Clostridiales bacterium]|jgi:chromate transporter|nr:chromate transporter [Clostridiales bacterium]OPZ70110.1 MAG: Chromate transport protein [Firmicutes bacterium ADurb.Bin467]
MKELLSMFAAFFRIGLFTFGGGYSMLPMLEREVVVRHSWATMDEVLDYFAISQCTPGIIAVNTATFVGYKRRGVVGGIFSALGVIMPSLLVILAIAALLTNFMHIELIQYAFGGIRIAVGALILGTVIKLSRSAVKQWWHALLCVAAFAASAVFKLNTIIIVATTIACAVACHFLLGMRGGKKA